MTRTRSRLVLCAGCGTLLERRQALSKRQRLECLMCVVGSALSVVQKAEESLLAGNRPLPRRVAEGNTTVSIG